MLGVNLTRSGQQIAYTTDNVKYTNATGAAIGTTDVSGIAQQTMPSIVSITSTTEGEGSYDLFGQYYQGQDEVSAGTGFIVGKNDKELLIATNYHVVDGADTVSVTCIDGETYEATVNGYDEDKDLAVVSVALSDISDDTMDQIQVATMGSSDDLKVGEQVVAIGNALGYGQSVTTGIVSAKNRKLNSDGSEESEDSDAVNLIQTDAAINPGNSGGALLNMKGEVIGIVSAKYSDTKVEGMGYAIPISTAKDIIETIINQEVVSDDEASYFGISGVDVASDVSKQYDMPTGVYVTKVAANSAASKAGIQKGDIIVSFNGREVSSMDEISNVMQYLKAGTKVDVVVAQASNNYEEKTMEVTLTKKK